MTLIAPVLGGYALLGEQGKMVPVSPQRIVSVVPSTAGPASGLVVAVTGGVGEVVSLWVAPVDTSTGSAGAATLYSCTVGAAGTVSFDIPSALCR